MPATSDATRTRILDAAAEEFARYGIAGARVNRIAEAAAANKERIYAYYGDKQQLFDTVMDRALAQAGEALAVDVADLPGSVGQIYELAVANPQLMRLLTWAQLEMPEPELADDHPRRVAHRAKVATIRQAQDDGLIDGFWDPADLLALVGAVALAWVSTAADLRHLVEPRAKAQPTAARRKAVEEAVRRLVEPRPSA